MREHHILIRVDTLDLEPRAATALAIGCTAKLGDDALEAVPTGGPHGCGPVTHCVRSELERPVLSPQESRQSLLAFELGQAAQVLAIEKQQIEHHDAQTRAGRTFAEESLQPRKAAAAVFFERHELTVQDAIAAAQPAH